MRRKCPLAASCMLPNGDGDGNLACALIGNQTLQRRAQHSPANWATPIGDCTIVLKSYHQITRCLNRDWKTFTPAIDGKKQQTLAPWKEKMPQHFSKKSVGQCCSPHSPWIQLRKWCMKVSSRQAIYTSTNCRVYPIKPRMYLNYSETQDMK